MKRKPKMPKERNEAVVQLIKHGGACYLRRADKVKLMDR